MGYTRIAFRIKNSAKDSSGAGIKINIGEIKLYTGEIIFYNHDASAQDTLDFGKSAEIVFEQKLSMGPRGYLEYSVNNPEDPKSDTEFASCRIYFQQSIDSGHPHHCISFSTIPNTTIGRQLTLTNLLVSQDEYGYIKPADEVWAIGKKKIEVPTVEIELGIPYDPIDIFYHISDTHFRDERDFTHIQAVVDRINGYQPKGMKEQKVLGVILTGDICDNNQRFDLYKKVFHIPTSQSDLTELKKKSIKPLRFPLFEGYGNHDGNKMVADIQNRNLEAIESSGKQANLNSRIPICEMLPQLKLPQNYTWIWHGWKFIEINTAPTGNSFIFLQTVLATTQSSQPVVICMHTSLDVENEKGWVNMLMSDEEIEALRKLLNMYDNVRMILNGHVHKTYMYFFKVGDKKKIRCFDAAGIKDNGRGDFWKFEFSKDEESAGIASVITFYLLYFDPKDRCDHESRGHEIHWKNNKEEAES